MPAHGIKRAYSYLIAAIFLAAIYVPFLGSITIEDSTKSHAEKRTLTPLPDSPETIKTLKRYPKKYNLYYQDNFGFREHLLWYKDLQYMIGDSTSDKVILGKNGWLFFNGEPFTDLQNSFRGLRKLKDSELKQYADTFSAKNQWLASKGVRYLFVIAPNKHSIYGEQLPESMFKIDSQTITDQLVNYLQEHTQVPILDLRQSLIKQKTMVRELYYKTDSHWNHFGSNIAQYEISKMLSSFFPDQIEPILHDEEDFSVNTGPGGDLAVLLGFNNKFVETYPHPRIDPCATRPKPKDDNYRSTFTTRCNKSDLKVIIFRDSFFEYLYQYISLYFKQSTFISKRLQYSDMEKYNSSEMPDVIIEEWAERFLTKTPQSEDQF